MATSSEETHPQFSVLPTLRIATKPWQPPKVKAFIETAIQLPLQDISQHLSNFHWEFYKEHVIDWSPLFNHFDFLFHQLLSPRSDIRLLPTNSESDDTTPFPENVVLNMLRVIKEIVENSTDLGYYPCLPFIGILLASSSTNIIMCSLEILSAMNIRDIDGGRYLYKSEIRFFSPIGKRIDSLAKGRGEEEFSSKVVFHHYHEPYSTYTFSRDFNQVETDDWSIMSEIMYVDGFIPPTDTLRFQLFTQIRHARAFGDPITRRLYFNIYIMAWTILLKSYSLKNKLESFYVQIFLETMYSSVNDDEIDESDRVLAVRAITAAHMKCKHGKEEFYACTNQMPLLTMFGKAETELMSKQEFARALLECSEVRTADFLNLQREDDYEKDLPLIIETGLRILENSDTSTYNHVSLASKVLTNLLQFDLPLPAKPKMVEGLLKMVKVFSKRVHTELKEPLAQHGERLMYNQERLVQTLLQSLTVFADITVDSHVDQILSSSFTLVSQKVGRSDGGIYYSAVTLMSKIIKHAKFFNPLHNCGVIDAFLSSVTQCALPCDLLCIMKGFRAICCHSEGSRAIEKHGGLHFLVDIFTAQEYLVAISGSIIPVANELQNILDCDSSLGATCVDIIIEIINKIALVKGSNNDHFYLLIHNVLHLVNTAVGHLQTCELFIKKSGHDTLMEKLILPFDTTSKTLTHIAVVLFGLRILISLGQANSFDSLKNMVANNRELLNDTLGESPNLLDKSFGLILKVPEYLDLETKKIYIKSKLVHLHQHVDNITLSVNRDNIFEDSYKQVNRLPSRALGGTLYVGFNEGMSPEVGGPVREWYLLVSRVMVDQKKPILFTAVQGGHSCQPNPDAMQLIYFKFCGRVVAKALVDEQLIDAKFTRSFYKHILGLGVTFVDLEDYDSVKFNSLKQMLKDDVSNSGLFFSISIGKAGAEEILYELVDNGGEVKVTEENKDQFVELVAEYHLKVAILPQTNAFLEGFYELIPKALISILNVEELDLLLNGLPNIDMNDVEANTEYEGYREDSPTIKCFWDIVKGFSTENKELLLQFCTATSKVPFGGFGSQAPPLEEREKYFQIVKAPDPTMLPTANTCFNRINLPDYPNREMLESKLTYTIKNCHERFGFI